MTRLLLVLALLAATNTAAAQLDPPENEYPGLIEPLVPLYPEVYALAVEYMGPNYFNFIGGREEVIPGTAIQLGDTIAMSMFGVGRCLVIAPDMWQGDALAYLYCEYQYGENVNAFITSEYYWRFSDWVPAP